MDISLENTAMVEGQIKPLSDINLNILNALYNIDRKDYTPIKFKNLSINLGFI